MTDLVDSRVLVLGLGVSGEAAAVLALRLQAQVTVLDGAATPTVSARAERLRALGAEVRLGPLPAVPPAADLVVISPGIAPSSPMGHLAASASVPVLSELAFGFRYCRCPVIAITGTNGKTTTTEWTTHLLQRAGRRVLAAGNIGRPLSEVALLSGDLDLIVAEVSSFQLEYAEGFRPVAAALLNCNSDHQDRYPTFGHYLETKCRVFQYLADPAAAIIGRDLLHTAPIQRLSAAWGAAPRVVCTEPGQPADWGVGADGALCALRDGRLQAVGHAAQLRLPGRHNQENALTALALCHAVGVDPAGLTAALHDFAPRAHRLEFIAERHGVRYINDSKATNPDALIQGVQAVAGDPLPGDRRVRLIAGGRDKDMDFTSVLPVLRAHVGSVYLIGETASALSALWSTASDCRRCDSLEQAVEAAIRDAHPGDIVLLSPGCASLDMFHDYQDRGNRFAHAVRRRLEEC